MDDLGVGEESYTVLRLAGGDIFLLPPDRYADLSKALVNGAVMGLDAREVPLLGGGLLTLRTSEVHYVELSTPRSRRIAAAAFNAYEEPEEDEPWR